MWKYSTCIYAFPKNEKSELTVFGRLGWKIQGTSGKKDELPENDWWKLKIQDILENSSAEYEGKKLELSVKVLRGSEVGEPIRKAKEFRSESVVKGDRARVRDN